MNCLGSTGLRDHRSVCSDIGRNPLVPSGDVVLIESGVRIASVWSGFIGSTSSRWRLGSSCGLACGLRHRVSSGFPWPSLGGNGKPGATASRRGLLRRYAPVGPLDVVLGGIGAGVFGGDTRYELHPQPDRPGEDEDRSAWSSAYGQCRNRDCAVPLDKKVGTTVGICKITTP